MTVIAIFAGFGLTRTPRLAENRLVWRRFDPAIGSGNLGFFVKSFAKMLAVAPLLIGATIAAKADTLNITGTGDNQFIAYLSTSDSSLGNLIGGTDGSNDNAWQGSVSLTTGPLSTTPLYLHIVLVNYTHDDGHSYEYGPGNPSAFIADLSITGSDYKFVDGNSSISTSDASHLGSPIWTGATTSAPGTWTTPTNAVTSYGANSDPATIWYQNRPGANPGLSGAAEWIAYGDQLHILYTDLSIELQNTRGDAGGEAPLPAAWTMMLLGMAGGATLFRRKRAAV